MIKKVNYEVKLKKNGKNGKNRKIEKN